MKHFSEQRWADLVRGIGPSQSRSEMEAHIASGCADCATSVGMWRKVRSIAINEPSLTPPADVERMVKLEFTARQSAKSELSVAETTNFRRIRRFKRPR